MVTEVAIARLVGTVWRGGEAEEELRLEVVEELAVGEGGGVVEFVNDDVVKVGSGEFLEVRQFAEGLDAGAEDVDLRVATVSHVVADGGAGADAEEGFSSLVEDLFAMDLATA